MRRLIAIALLCGGVWAGLTVYREGPDRAFGGVLAGIFAEVDQTDSTRALAVVQRVHAKSSERANRALGDEGFRD